MAEVYTHAGYIEGYPEGIERHFWHITRNDIVYRWLAPRVRAGDLVMDVGCGTGHVVRELRSRGIDVQGVELGSAPVAPGMEAAVHTETDLFDLDSSVRDRIKIVLLLDVIEHMADRRQFLRRISRELPNCRQVLVTVPARAELWSDYDEYWGHYLRYDRPGLEADLREGGFEPQKTAYFFHCLYLVTLLVKWLGISRSVHFQPLKSRGPKAFFHTCLAFASRLESRLLPRKLIGSSIISIASRKP